MLDLNANGLIDLLSVAEAHAYFELTGDEAAENTGWVDHNSGDGFLVYDRNGDGRINDITELFGNAEEQGFVELAELDSNSDGTIDTNDTEFSELQIWVDGNGNGYTEDGELFALSDYDIASISLTNTRISETVAGGLPILSNTANDNIQCLQKVV